MAVRTLGLQHEFEVDATEDAEVFTDSNLAEYAVVIFLNTTGDVLNETQQAAFEQFIRNGGGFVGIHAAADTEYNWPFYGELVGAYFQSHPPTEVSGSIKVVDSKHPSTAMLPESWERVDEWYNYQSNPRGDVHVLAVLDEGSYNGGNMGPDHPIAWCHTYEGGRSWYTGGGHTIGSFAEPLFLEHILYGIEYAAGEIDGECGATIWENYDKITLDANTENPMALDVAPDGRVFYVERAGAVQIYLPDQGLTTTAGTLEVETSNEDGLIGIALDPAFSDNGWVYLFNSPAGDVGVQHISRFTMQGNALDMDSEVVILEIPVQREQCCHSGGAMLFDGDGNLYIATGDNTNPFESSGFAPIDEREGRSAWDAQKSSGNTDDLRGKILRISPQPDGSYTIPEGNLFATVEEGRPEIYVMGVRNPFRMSIDEETGWLYWGDVGPDAGSDNFGRGPRGYDEWNQARTAGHFGWPYCIADNQAYRDYDFGSSNTGPAFDCAATSNDSPNNTGAEILPPAQPAWIWYPYAPSEEFPGVTTGGGRTAMAGPVYNYDAELESKRKLPTYFDETLFIYEWARNWIHEVKLDAEGGVLAIQPFLSNQTFLRPIDMKMGPEGAIYVLEWGTGFGGDNSDSRLVRIEYVEGSRAPIIVADAAPLSGPAPLTVQFNSDATFDPDPGETVSFAWDFQADGLIDAAEPNPSFTYENEGSYTAILMVSDPEGNTASTSFRIVVGNSVPVVTLQSPAQGTFFDWGEPVDFSLSVVDAEDGSTEAGTIDCADVTLQLFLGHDEHTHPLDQINACEGRFTVSDEDHGSEGDRLFYVVEAIYTDQGAGVAGSLTSRAQHILQPKRIEGEHYSFHEGIRLEDSQDELGGGVHLAFIDHGDYVVYESIDLYNIHAMTFRIASAGAGGRIEVRTGGVEGPLLGYAHVENTGGWQTFRDVTIPVADPGGVNDLYLVFVNEPGFEGLFNINWIDFVGPGLHTDAPVGGLTAEYFENINFTGNSEVYTDPLINFNWSTEAPRSLSGIDTYSVRWSGTLTPEYDEPYRFYARSDDGMRVWINGELIIDNWQDQPPTELSSQDMNLVTGTAYPLVVEYYEAAGGAQAHLYWSSPSTVRQLVPNRVLAPEVVATDLDDDLQVVGLTLNPIFPNPVRDRGTLVFNIEETGPVLIQIHDILGRHVQNLHDGVFPKGTHVISVSTNGLASGVYFCRIQTDAGQRMQRFVVAK